MAESKINNPLIPKKLTVELNSGSLDANSYLHAYQIGKLIFVSGDMIPAVTGTDLKLATIKNVVPIEIEDTARFVAPIGAYNNQTQEVYINKDSNNPSQTVLSFNTTAITHFKVNFCFIAK